MPTATYYSKINQKNLNHIKVILNSGGIVIYPTETVWAIGCKSTLKKSVEKIYSIKNRKTSSPIISLLADYKQVDTYADSISNLKEFKIINSSDNPPTIIYPNCKKEIAHISNEKNEVAFRITPIEDLKEIINIIDSPLASTSANISGEPTTTNLESIDKSILNNVDLILNFKLKFSGIPSKIIKFNKKGEIQYLRK